ncbi:phosphotransferase family protein [Plenodomus tracheiphilus IPT5]|uniref:Altered inheritance of mitochondria protein 9, mitochondrial n=1 Tax=Plenodomus tracheiphilus IPT5 TaxID=1408161 RepID=A0A6A7AU34_9PLEO|nr:phosphotransferase family protein [Plenodomus tracheiphilus IPT5]
MNELAKVAADSVGAAHCVDVRKFTDGMFNKAFLMLMDDGQEVVAKVPKPNASRAHYTTASELATMDFARRVLDTPAPYVYAWNSNAQSHSVGAEYIIMGKAKGVPLSQVWDTMVLPQKLQVLLALVQIQKRWLTISFSHYGGLYYAKDVRPSSASHYVQDGIIMKDSGFVVGPATSRDWHDAGRAGLDIERGPCNQYLRSIGERETKATRVLKPPKQIALFCGSKLYQPDPKEKLTALDHNPGKITAIIDWQSCHISPLFNHNTDPAFLHWDGLEPENLELTPKPDLSGLSSEEKSAALRDYAHLNVFIAWRKLMQAKIPDLFKVTEFRKTASYGLLFLAHRMFEYGEAHFQCLLVDLKDTWPTLTAVRGQTLFPLDFSDAEVERIKSKCDCAVAGTELVAQLKETMGELWPDKAFIDHEQYDSCRAALVKIKEQLIEHTYESHWPFDSTQ